MDTGAFFPAYHLHLRRDTTITPASYDAGYVVLSYFTSLVGCVTTLELLNRRTSTRGAYNWFLLLASAITMGGIGIWGMHFVGNRAVILDHGAADRQILYNVSFTALSFFLPILVLLAAFYMLGIPDRAHHLQIAVAGFLTGSAVCGMHYIGQLGIDNYHCAYYIQNVVGAAFIAVVASLVALSVFFRLRDMWTDTWWKRALCGAILACAVSGMHWTAAVGTIYEWKGNLAVHGNSRAQTSIIAFVLSLGACIVLLIITIVRGRSIRNTKIKAQKLVLACAYFDDDGRLMVTQEGALPSEKITNHYVDKTWGEDELNRSHATYIWMFMASRNWLALREFASNIKGHAEPHAEVRKYLPEHVVSDLHADSSDLSINFTLIFKRLFCVAAQHLANLLHEPLEALGVLFEEPLDTGAIHIPALTSDVDGGTTGNRHKSIEFESDTGPRMLARGKYLFLNRQLKRDEAAKFATLGYRFAPIEQVAELLARNMQVERSVVMARLERMRLSVSTDRLPPPGVHLACFMVRPSVHKGFDILVPAATQNQLPFSTIRLQDLSQLQIEQLQGLDNLTVNEILRMLVNSSSGLKIDEEFRWQLYNSFVKLVDVVGDPNLMMHAKFSAKEFRTPCRSSPDSSSPVSCTLLIVRFLCNIHASSKKQELTYVPLSFFSAQQQLESDKPSDNSLARKLKMEFGHSGDPQSGHKGASEASIATRAVSAESTGTMPVSHRPSLLSFIKGRIVPSRMSDEITMVAREPNLKERGDVEMSMLETGMPATQASLTELMPAEANKSSWVTGVFDLFQLGEECWSSERPAWKWDINVENSFEVVNKDSNLEEG